jgi:formylglycine-generating enzyme required for sulfatase activity
MAGNVFQWCRDGKRTYTKDRCIDPVGLNDGTHVFRGGSCDTRARFCRSAWRDSRAAAVRTNDTGFRIVVRLD